MEGKKQFKVTHDDIYTYVHVSNDIDPIGISMVMNQPNGDVTLEETIIQSPKKLREYAEALMFSASLWERLQKKSRKNAVNS